MVMIDDCHIGDYQGTIGGRKFNGLLFNVYMLGSARRSSEAFNGERTVGGGLMFEPWTHKISYHSNMDRTVGLAVAIDFNSFRMMSGKEMTKGIVEALLRKYVGDKPFQFMVSDISMAYCYAFYCIY
jgi:hypothetical protein